MFLGHYGAAMAAKPAAKNVSVGMLLMATQFADLLWPTLLLLGIEKVEIKPGVTVVTPLDFTYYPYTHSLLMDIVWGILLGGIYFLVQKDKRGALLIALCVVSHWFLDLLVHIPDLPLYPGSPLKFGFGLWNSMLATQLLEAIFFFGGMLIYLRSTKPNNKTGMFAFWGFIVFMLVSYFINLFSPPPPGVTAIAWAAQFQWVLVLWAFWFDRNRSPR